MNQKKAILVVSFGSSHLDTLERSIKSIEQEISAAMPEFTLRRAFTSEIILKKLRNESNLNIDNVEQALKRLEQESFEQVLIQPTHIINGEEYNKLCRQTMPFQSKMKITIGTPLLTGVEDYCNLVRALMGEITPPAEEEAVVFMGHGTIHPANASYALLDYIFHDFGWERAFVGTVEGYPELSQVIRRLHQMPQVHRIRLYPLLVVAGDHVKNDMAGQDDQSWRALLEAEGYEVTCILTGLGEYQSVRNLFVQHACTAWKK